MNKLKLKINIGTFGVWYAMFVKGKNVYGNRIFKLADSSSPKTQDIHCKIQTVKSVSRNNQCSL